MNVNTEKLSPENKLALEVVQAPKKLALFKSRANSIKYVFSNGHVAPFIKGRFFTDDPDKIAELTRECNAGHPDIYIDVEEVVADPRLDDPKLRMRAQIIAELMEQEQKAIDPDRDMGKTENASNLNAASTTTIAAAAAGGSGAGLKAQLSAFVNR